MTDKLKAPMPYFGGKSKVAGLVWQRLGDVDNYVEPFFGSGAVLLGRPHEPKVETVNDLNAFICNFWRAVQSDPDAVAMHADWPVNETDLHARHRWLVYSEESQNALQRVKDDPDYYDAKIAGRWCHGACCWIGSGWCDDRAKTKDGSLWAQSPRLGDCGGGVNSDCPTTVVQVPRLSDRVGVLSEQMPNLRNFAGSTCVPETTIDEDRLSSQGDELLTPLQPPRLSGCNGVNRKGRVQLADAYSRGRGVNGNDSASKCDERRQWLTNWMYRLADRLRSVRVCCGHWNRICNSPSTTTRLGVTGAFLDPPYRKTVGGKQNRHGELYANDKQQDVDSLCDEVQEWCLKWGDNPEMRIALCGYEGEYDLPGWTVEEWRAVGGYGNQSGKVNDNAGRERIWFSPHCVQPNIPAQISMF